MAFWSGSGLVELDSTPPPRISTSVYNLNSRVGLFSDLLILFHLNYPEPISTVFTNEVRSAHFIPGPCFILSPQFVFFTNRLSNDWFRLISVIEHNRTKNFE